MGRQIDGADRKEPVLFISQAVSHGLVAIRKPLGEVQQRYQREDAAASEISSWIATLEAL